MRKFYLIPAAVLVLALSFQGVTASEKKEGGVGADQALKMLEEGNARYTGGKTTHPHGDAASREAVAQAQHPFAIVLGCSDSRVPPEVLFDQGVGDLFVVRTAGNVVDDVVLGSIEYAAEHLGSALVVVLGHERCGAVKATAAGGEAPGHLPSLVKAIQPSVDKAKGMQGDLVENAVDLNVQAMAKEIETSQPILAKLVEEGKVKVIGGKYDLDTGKVEFKK